VLGFNVDKTEKMTESTQALYPIGTVADLTNVNSITLRAWEKRHGLIEPIRKESGHRLYTKEQIDLISRVVELLDQGMRIGQVKAFLDAEPNGHEPAPAGRRQGVDAWKGYIDDIIKAVTQFNETALAEVYNRALSLHPADEVTAKLSQPLIREIERRWENGQGSIAEKHFFNFYIRNKLGARFHHRTKSKAGPRLLLACLPGDRYETGLLLLALAANAAGYRTISLGANMPLAELPAVARETACRGIVLTAEAAPDRELLEHALPDLARRAGVPVFFGGQASAKNPEALERAGVTALGTDLQAGLERLLATIPTQ
jgi:DNA-binding transcriptional MerR regulator/methylmalonyl-CoA mutase cobalamin-binding subunit